VPVRPGLQRLVDPVHHDDRRQARPVRGELLHHHAADRPDHAAEPGVPTRNRGRRILANASGLACHPVRVAAPRIVAAPIPISSVFLLTWSILIGLRPLPLGRLTGGTMKNVDRNPL
jgi:hypothetical protein